MPTLKIIFTYIASLATFLFIDALWLGLIAKNFYQKNLGHLLAPQVNWGAALLFYSFYIVGVLVFCVIPFEDNTKAALLHGALLGAIAYSTYDLSNLATIKDWPLTVVVVDIIWGMFITAAVALVGSLVLQRV